MADIYMNDASIASITTLPSSAIMLAWDPTDNTDTGSGTQKKITFTNFLTNLPSYDLLAALTNAEVSVTTATTATLGKLHVCSGTSANYTVTLPSVSGNAGKFIAFRMSPALTKLVTLDAGSGVTIYGFSVSGQTRVMWAKESAILYCDGSNWHAIANNTIPMSCNMARATSLSGGSGSLNIDMDTTVSDPTGQMSDTVTHKGIVFVRPGVYLMLGTASYSSLSANATNLQAKLNVNGTQVRNVTANGLLGAYVSVECAHSGSVSAGDYLTLSTYLSLTVNLYVSSPYENQISVLEQP